MNWEEKSLRNNDFTSGYRFDGPPKPTPSQIPASIVNHAVIQLSNQIVFKKKKNIKKQKKKQNKTFQLNLVQLKQAYKSQNLESRYKTFQVQAHN